MRSEDTQILVGYAECSRAKYTDKNAQDTSPLMSATSPAKPTEGPPRAASSSATTSLAMTDWMACSVASVTAGEGDREAGSITGRPMGRWDMVGIARKRWLWIVIHTL